mgnify:CR=1 FL=1
MQPGRVVVGGASLAHGTLLVPAGRDTSKLLLSPEEGHDPSLLRTFIEESLRLRAPTQGLSTRLTSQDERFGDVGVPKGSVLHLRWAAANIDPEEFECPLELQLDRKAASRHLSFSAGPRVCPGAGISRLEQQIAWTRLLERLESMRYGSDNTFLHQPGIMLGTLQLNLELVKAAK